MEPRAPSQEPPASEQIRRWRESDDEKTVGGFVDAMGTGGFALIFIITMGLPALPIPTGGITNVFEVVAMLTALQLVAGRRTVWIPGRWRRMKFDDGSGQRFVDSLIRTTTWLERFSRPRLSWIFGHWWSDVAFGLIVLAGAISSFVAPPFSGIDTIPAFGVIVLSVGLVMYDFAYVAFGLLLIAAAIVLELTLGAAIYGWMTDLI